MAKDYMLDMEKGMEDAPAPVQAIVGGEEQALLIPDVLQFQPIEGGTAIRIAAKMNSKRMKKWQLYRFWLLLVASAMVLINHVFSHGGENHDAPHDKLITPALVMFAVLLCAISLMVYTIKQNM